MVPDGVEISPRPRPRRRADWKNFATFLFRFMRLARRHLFLFRARLRRSLAWPCAALACKVLMAHPDMSSNNSGPGDFTAGGISKSVFRRRSKRQTRNSNLSETEDKRPGANTLAHTRNLLLAALRVWELKQGIRDY